jgi:DNA mismatch repair protein MutS
MTSRSQSSAARSEAANGHGAPVVVAAPSFVSILFAEDVGDATHAGLEDLFADLNLDQILAALTAGREGYRLEELFRAPLSEHRAIAYRHEVLRDLERQEVREPVARFARSMSTMRKHQTQIEQLHYELEKQGWMLDSVEIYCDAVSVLASDLADLDLRSQGMRSLRSYLAAYAASDRFRSLAAETRGLKDALAQIRYALLIRGPRVTVSRYGGEPDYTAEVERVFARFRHREGANHLANLTPHAGMDHVEAWIAERVARLYPEVFEPLARFCERHGDVVDPTVGRFDREVQFYLAYLDMMDSVRRTGLAFCLPEVREDAATVAAEQTFDLALALKLNFSNGDVVVNDVHLTSPERILVVSGPNNGGKTTFARMFGQLHYLASLGLPVPGRAARLQLPDRVFSHFEREEQIETLRGKLEDELVRIRAILDQAGPRSVIVMNESFNSTTLEDARLLGAKVIEKIARLRCLAVYVTFIDELASLNDATVSMVSTIEPDNPAKRTFKIVRRPADGLAYAAAIAEKYGLTFDHLIRRIP